MTGIKQLSMAAIAVGVLAGCGGGSTDPGAVSADEESNTTTPVPVAAPAPGPVSAPATSPAPTPTPAPTPVPTPSPSPSPGATPVGIELQGGYPTVRMECSVGTPMKLQREWDVNYNGGVLRLTSLDGDQEEVVWQMADIVDEQRGTDATFSAPTSDGRQAWLNVDCYGAVIGAGIHGDTPDSYVRCGNAQDGVASVGPESVIMACRQGVALDEDGNPTPGADFQYTYENWQIDYDFSTHPYKSIVNVSRPEMSFGEYRPGFVVDAGFGFNGEPATAVFPEGAQAPPIYYFSDESLIGVTQAGRFVWETGWMCERP